MVFWYEENVIVSAVGWMYHPLENRKREYSQRLTVTLALLCFLLGLVMAPLANGQELRRGGYIGILTGQVTDEARARLHLADGGGVLVLSLLDGGPVKAAGLQADDVITQLNDRKIATINEFLAAVTKLRVGDSVAVHFIRGSVAQVKQLVIKPRPYESSPDAQVLYRSVQVDSSLRRVIVTAPKSEGKHPAVLYVNGIGCFSQESLNLSSVDTKLLYGLTRAGFVTMRVEKSGIGDSEGPPCMSDAVDLKAEMRGYLAGLKALKAYPFVDSKRVFILGLSIGGVEAPLLAEQVPVKGVVVVNTVAKPFLEYLTDTRRRQNLLRHVAYDEMEQRMRLNLECNYRLLIERQTPDQVLKDAPECSDFIEYPAPYTYMQQWAAPNLAQEWKKVIAPVLIVYGTSDYISTIADDPYLSEMINSFHPGHATLEAVQNMDHYMTRASSMEESTSRKPGTPGEFEPKVLQVIREWLERQALCSSRNFSLT